MIDRLKIRPEMPEDYKATELMTMRSFWNKYWPGCTEHFLIRIIRESEDYLPEISRIAELDGRIVGAVYYTRAWLADGETRQEIATFGPLAVEPTLEGNDIGGALMRETIKLAKEAGIAAIALMVEEAGGKSTRIDGQPLEFVDAEQAVFTNGLLHQNLVDILK